MYQEFLVEKLAYMIYFRTVQFKSLIWRSSLSFFCAQFTLQGRNPTRRKDMPSPLPTHLAPELYCRLALLQWQKGHLAQGKTQKMKKRNEKGSKGKRRVGKEKEEDEEEEEEDGF
ncbi:hypothetical protein Cadr_000001952 [Camelus dromedarius]|uniref:Uncharacterized protein n=1 Tax=Camelus dromedarius TaxID=9838 RepID=A0A5N4EGC2_CAMDR|nr:hypothetical protein Cadr_000001952 [Camelus dromedarius]